MSFHEAPLLFTHMKSDSWNRWEKLLTFTASCQQEWSNLSTYSRHILIQTIPEISLKIVLAIHIP
jgi:hypothetical protein